MVFQPDMTSLPTFFALSSNIWDQLSDAASLVIALLFILAGALIGFVLRWLIGRWQADSAEKSAMMRAEAVKPKQCCHNNHSRHENHCHKAMGQKHVQRHREGNHRLTRRHHACQQRRSDNNRHSTIDR